MANKNVFSKSYFTYFLTCHRGPRRVYILKFWRVRFDISRFYDHFCHPGCPPHISGTAAAVVTKLAQVQCSDICLPYCYHMQPQRPLASSEGRSKPGYPSPIMPNLKKSTGIFLNISRQCSVFRMLVRVCPSTKCTILRN